MSVPMHGGRASRGRAICAEARRAASAASGRTVKVRLRVTCLDDTGGGRRWALASVGADARRALEDTSTVAYVGEPEADAARFSAPILESAGIPQLARASGRRAISEISGAIRAAGSSGNLREAVLEELR